MSVIVGDCRVVLPCLPSGVAQCCVTSPPYFGLRDYGVDGQIGLERTLEAYVAEMVSVFREVRRVLREDGTLWLNVGDSYVNKQRQMVPARVALALQADGWLLRDEIVWHKPRTTPAPVKDRTVAAHEMVYLLAPSRSYFFDWEALETPAKYPGVKRRSGKAFRDLAESDPNAARKRPSADREITVRDTTRARSVWSVSPSPYPAAHFATMPPDLAERCIRGGSRAGDVVLDPFAGAGTTAMVAKQLGRYPVSIELNPEYAALISERAP